MTSGHQDFVEISITGQDSSTTLVNTVHEIVVCTYSNYFRGVFKNQNYIEGVTRKSEITGDPNVFKLVVNWMYHQFIMHRKSDLDPILKRY